MEKIASLNMTNRALFLDRDGVINKQLMVDGSVYSPRNLNDIEILPNVDLALKKAKELKLLLIIFTNQPDVSRGIIKKEEMDKIHRFMEKKFDLDDVFMCPHDDNDNCSCRKPKPGMILDAAAKWQIDLSSSFVVGDRWKDVSAGKQAGCTTFLIKTDAYSDSVKPEYNYMVRNLYSAVEIITNILSEKVKL